MINYSGGTFLGKSQDDLIGLLGGEVFNCLNSFDGEGCGKNANCSKCSVRTRVASTFQTGKPHLEEEGRMIFLIKGEKTIIDLLISTTLLKLDGNNKVLLSLTNITDLKQAKESLAEKSLYLDNILRNSTGYAIATTDIDLRITYYNPMAEQFFGYIAEDVIGKTIQEMHTKEKVEQGRLEKAIEIVRTQGEYKYKVVQETNNGNRHLSSRVTGIRDRDGALVGFVLFTEDITEKIISEKELQKLQEQVTQSQKMESIGTLAGGIAHDFNNILFPILGHSEMLLEDISDNDPLNDSVREIYSGALRAKELVQQILTFSRQEKSEMKLLKIQPILKEALKMIRSTVPTTIDILQNIETGCGAVKADPTQIHQIIMNLMTNAYHAMEENGGTMEVLLKQIELRKLDLINPNMEPGHYACLIVKDTGMGMDKELIAKIFDPFFTTKENGKGTGMGLSVVHGIVNGMKGGIQVNSQSREGTAFHVYFPIRKSVFTNGDTHPETKNQRGVEHILLVDDEKAILNMEKKMLERLGYKVTSRTSSIEAREAFRDHPDKFDLIITDMAMPKLPGEKLAVDLIKIRPDIPILICTGFSETMSEEKVKSLGINGLLLKPMVLKDLAKKIREVLDP